MMAGTYRHFFLARQLNELRLFLVSLSVSNVTEAGFLAYVVQHYVLLAAAESFAIPLIRFEDLALSEPASLTEKLACMSGFNVEPPALAKALISSRMPNVADKMRARREGFLHTSAPSWLEKVFAFLWQLSPELRPYIDA
jgi:hypothetical protein